MPEVDDGFVENVQLTADIRKDFLLNKDDFALSFYCRLDLTTDASFYRDGGQRYAYCAEVPNDPARTWDEVSRRARCLAQQVMASRVIEVEAALSAVRTIAPDEIHGVLSSQPVGSGMAMFVMNPDTRKRAEHLLGYGVGIQVEDSMNVSTKRGLVAVQAGYAIAESVVYLVWRHSGESAGAAPGLSVTSFANDCFRVEVRPPADGLAVAHGRVVLGATSISVVDSRKVIVNGHCYQFRV